MKTITLNLIMALSILSQVNASIVKPEMYQCSPLMNTKKYLSTNFETYPRRVIFECTYECNDNNKIFEVIGTSNVYITTISEDATMTACQGVIIKKVPWGYDFDKITPFYAPETGLIEIKRWAFEHVNFDPIVNQKERENLQQLKQTLQQVGYAYSLAGESGVPGSLSFKEAAHTLFQVAENLPQNPLLLDEIIQQIVMNKGIIKSPGSAEALIQSMISSSAAWRIPLHLYK